MGTNKKPGPAKKTMKPEPPVQETKPEPTIETTKPNPKVRIVEVALDSPIVVCRDNIPVPIPMWEAKTEEHKDTNASGVHLYDGEGSIRPGAIAIDDKKHRGLTVTIEVDNIDNYENPFLSGELSFENDDVEVLEAPVDMLIQTKFTASLKEKTSNTLVFSVLPDPAPEEFHRLYGLVSWTLKYTSNLEGASGRQEIKLEETYLEIFWIYGTPGKMYKKGVWVEVLRLLDLECFGLNSRKEVVYRIVNYCFGGMGLRYDVFMGSSHYVYGWIGGGFDLKAYLDKEHPFCNCYDQAGAVQTLLGALGIYVNFHCLFPFGYLRHTDLIGRGKINNPFIFSSGDRQMQAGILPSNHKNRSAFGEHGFCTWDNGDEKVVLDACTGPFLGRSTIQEYLESTVDGLTELYSRSHGVKKPGRINDIEICPGVTDVHSLPSIPNIPNKMKKKMEGFAGSGIEEFKDLGVNVNIEEIDAFISTQLDNELGWKEISKRFRCGYDTSSHEWNYRAPNQYIQVSLSVANNIKSANDLFQMMAASSELPGIPFKKGPQKDKEENLFWFTPYYKITMWWYHNLCIKMVGYNFPSYLFQMIRNKLKDMVSREEEKKVVLSECIPNFNNFRVEVNPSNTKMSVGSRLSIAIHPVEQTAKSDRFASDFFLAGDGLRLIGEDSNPGLQKDKKQPYTNLKFKCTSPGFTGVGLVMVDRKNLLCSKLHWEMIHIS